MSTTLARAAPAKVYQHALKEAGISATSFGVDDCQAEYARLKALGSTR